MNICFAIFLSVEWEKERERIRERKFLKKKSKDSPPANVMAIAKI